MEKTIGKMEREKEMRRITEFTSTEFTSTEFVSTEFATTKFVSTDFISCARSSDKSIKSLKEYIKQFSPYDVVDTIYDVFYSIPDVMDAVEVNFLDVNICCDKYDYIFAAMSGIITGLVDAFFVGKPGESLLGKVTDKAVDSVVIRFSKMIYAIDDNKTQKKKPDTIASAIGYLERRFKVNYDARFPKDLCGGEVLEGFNPSSHHLKSLAHCPDVVGLFFSVLDQFTQKTTVVSNGKLFRLANEGNEVVLYGDNAVTKVICGIINWFGHLMSDISGSSGTRGHDNKRGMGIPIPGFELFQFYGKKRNDEINGLAKLTEQMFLNGYDFRFGVAMAIPVVINDFITKLMWALRERYQYNKEWKSIIRIMPNDKRLIRMNLVSSGCFSLVDIGDAAIRSEGNLLCFALRINYIGICKFALAGYREVLIHVADIQEECIDEMLENEWSRCTA